MKAGCEGRVVELCRGVVQRSCEGVSCARVKSVGFTAIQASASYNLC